MAIATVSEKGWVVIPKEIRERLRLHKGSKVAIVEYAGKISIMPLPQDPIRDARGMFRDGPSLTETHMREKREEEAYRDAKFEMYFPARKRGEK
jgi:AbrB family looped-hinge helix DNA binding protein